MGRPPLRPPRTATTHPMTAQTPGRPPANELNEALRALRNAFMTVGTFSGFINLMMLAPALYMLQVYDRVLGSRNVTTLVMLTVLVVGVTTHAALGQAGSPWPVGLARLLTLAVVMGLLTVAVRLNVELPLAGMLRFVQVVVWPALKPPALELTYVNPALKVSVRLKFETAVALGLLSVIV